MGFSLPPASRAMLALAVLLLVGLAACAPRDSDLAAGEAGKVRSVRSGDSLVLEGGLVVRLAGVEAPRRGAPAADEARAALEKLALGRQAELRYGGLRRLRDGSALAHVFVKTEGGRRLWAQGEMLRQGMARVHTRKDNRARAGAMLVLEAQARGARRGLWSDAAYAVRRADEIPCNSGIEGAPASAPEPASDEPG